MKKLRLGTIVAIFILLFVSYTLGKKSDAWKITEPKNLSLSKDNSTSMKMYANEKVGISIRYPPEVTFIREEDSSNGWYLLLTNSKDVINRSMPGVDVSESTTPASISISIRIKNDTEFEIPFSGGKVVTIIEDNLSLFHQGGPEKLEKGFLRSHPTLKSRVTILNKEGHLTFSVLDTNRLIKIQVDTNDLQQFPYQILDKIISSFQFI